MEQHIKEKTKIVRGKKGVTSLFSHAIHLICTEKQPQNHPGSDTRRQTATMFGSIHQIIVKGFSSSQMDVGLGAADAIRKVHGMNYTVGTSPDVLCKCTCCFW